MVNVNDIASQVAEFLPDDYSVSVFNATKNNGIKKHGILINNGSVLSPVIYVDDLIKEGFDMSEIAIKVVEQYKKAKEQEVPFDTEDISDFSEMKKMLCYRLINSEYNKETMDDIPFERINNDLALVYFLDLGQNAMITVTNNLIKLWGISEEELYEIAKDNTPLIYPPDLRSMADVMIDILGQDMEMMKMQFGKTEMNDEEFRSFLKSEVIGEELPMYVLRGREMYGATALIYDDMLSILQERFGDVYVIPSSVHEVLIIPVDEARSRGITSTEIRDMVVQVNETTVAPEDRLSDNVYLINKDGLSLVDVRNDMNIDDDIR